MGKLKHAPQRLSWWIGYMQGHRKRSEWLAFAVGIAFLATFIVGEIAIRSKSDHRVIIGTNDEVYYYRRATKEDALALGLALKSTGFFNNRGTSVLLWKGGGPTVVSFVLNQGAWDHPNAISNFAEIGRRVANSVGGFPIQVHLVDALRNVQKELVVGKASIGAHDAIYYFGAATEADARALGEALHAAGYFEDLGVTVALLKGEGTVVSFVVQEGAWDQPAVAATMERLVRQVAPSAGGLPVKLRLLNREMEIKKEVAIQ